jgi:hypothetical protein
MPCLCQVSSLSLAQLLSLSWPGGQRLLTVRQAVALVAPAVKQVILDVKTSTDKASSTHDARSPHNLLLSALPNTAPMMCFCTLRCGAVVGEGRCIVHCTPAHASS